MRRNQLRRTWSDENVKTWAEQYLQRPANTLMQLESDINISHSTLWWCFTHRLENIDSELSDRVLMQLKIHRSEGGFMKDYYTELNNAIRDYEEHRPYKRCRTDYITDKIAWCWKWKKITAEQLDDLSSRMIKIFQEGLK